MSFPTDFPEPTIVSVNGVELEVFEAGRENVGNVIHRKPNSSLGWPGVQAVL